GAASGFGAGIAERFAAEGARVMVADLNADGARQVAARIGGGAVAQGVNVAAAEEVQAMVDAAHAAFGRLDILVNNAGVTHLPAPLEDVSEADFDRVVAVNMRAIYLAARVVVPRMKAQGSGSILNMASTAGLSPRPRLSW